MTHKHDWKRDNTRIHGRPPRFFVRCVCGANGQAVINYNSLHVFQTSTPRLNKKDVKRVRTVRISDNDMVLIEDGSKHLAVIDGRITIAV